MRTADIEVGKTYAYRSHSWATPMRAEVLETGVARVEGQYRHSRRTVRNGVRVKMTVRGEETESIVTARQIDQPWDAYTEARDRRARQRSEAEEKHRTVLAERARQARVLEDHLAGHGVEPRQVHVWDAEEREALNAALFTLGDANFVLSRISGLRTLMHDGAVPLGDLAPVLADIEQRQVV